MSWRRGIVVGVLAGAAGTTALNTVSYLDMLISARPASDTSEVTITKLEEVIKLRVPGDEVQHNNRVAALGPMTGIAVGVTIGAVLEIARSLGWRPGAVVLAVVATSGALIGSNTPMTLLEVTDPRKWSARAWISDIIPHLAFGIATATVLWKVTPRQ